MDNGKFHAVYHMGRNGCNRFFRHPIAIGGRFEYSDGVKDLADLGCFWFLDIVSTECLVPLRKSGYPSCLIEVVVKKETARIAQTVTDNAPPIWKRKIDYTDMPEGRWVFELVDEGSRFAFTLMSEH
jgi:hypothetical protein